MKKSNIPDSILDRIRRSHAAYFLTVEEALSIMPNLKTAVCAGDDVWGTAHHRSVEDHDTVEVSIKFKISSDAL